MKILKSFENTEDYYYYIRKCRFRNEYKKAARFIYLNQTSFNGIYRINQKGIYNVPYGFRNKSFLDEDALRGASGALKQAAIYTGDFYSIVDNIRRNDLVFLDPPYTVSHNDNGFIKYNQKLFSLQDQERLSSLIDEIKRKDAYYVLTNAAHHRIKDIFDKGDKIYEFERANLIGGENAQRGHTTEYVFTNVDNEV